MLPVTVQSPPSLETEATYVPFAIQQRGGKYFNTKIGKAFFKSAVARQHPNKEVNFMGHECLICLCSVRENKKPTILFFKTHCGLRATRNKNKKLEENYGHDCTVVEKSHSDDCPVKKDQR